MIVEPQHGGGWQVSEGDGKLLESFMLKRDATNAGRNYLRHHGGGELVIRNLSGRLTERDTVPRG